MKLGNLIYRILPYLYLPFMCFAVPLLCGFALKNRIKDWVKKMKPERDAVSTLFACLIAGVLLMGLWQMTFGKEYVVVGKTKVPSGEMKLIYVRVK